MLLPDEKSKCLKNQKIIVSKDKRTPREHRAVNPNGKYDVRQFKLDGELVKNEKCCDFLLLNDTLERSYYIELKDGNIEDAIPQLEKAVSIFQSELPNYEILYRIICSKVRTHGVGSNMFRKFQDKVGSSLKYKSIKMEEGL